MLRSHIAKLLERRESEIIAALDHQDGIQLVVERWHELPDVIRKAILALIESWCYTWNARQR